MEQGRDAARGNHRDEDESSLGEAEERRDEVEEPRSQSVEMPSGARARTA